MARILCIDDESSIRSVIRRALSRAGHEVVEAEDGAEGLRLFQASDFDLVITDLIMPDKEGIETIMDLRSLNPNLRILVVSGGLSRGSEAVGQYGPLVDAEALGADRSLEKPFDVGGLVEVVESLLAEGPRAE